MAGPWEAYQSKPAPTPAPAPAKKAQPKPYSKRAAFDALRASDAEMNAAKRTMTPQQWKKALTTYYADPTIKRLRRDAGLPETFTRDEELASIARAKFKAGSTQPVVVKKGASKEADESAFGSLTRRRKATPEEKRQILRTGRVDDQMGLETSFINSFGRMLFGVPERIIAAFDDTPGSYDERLKVRRQVTDMQRGRNVVGDVGGAVGGAVASGAGAAGALRLAGRGIAALPGGQAAGNFIQNLTQLQQGQRAGNAARIVAAGAGGGGAQALGEGSDVTTGTVTGAVAAPLAVAGAKGVEWASRPVRDFLRASSAPNILRRFTSATAEDVERAAADFRQATGREPTVFEVLPAGDRQGVEKLLKKMPEGPRERATELVRERVSAMPEEMSARTAEITGPQARFMQREMALDLARARGATNPTADELALAGRAVRDPTELEMVRQTVSRSIMAPFDERIAFETVGELLPTAPVNMGNGRIVEEIVDEGAANAIRSVSRPRSRGPDGVTVRDMTDMISDLREDARAGGIDGRAAQRAADHLEDMLEQAHPDVAAARIRMTEAHAARSRMMEGVTEGSRTRLREDVPVSGNKDARRVRNAYETSEGAAGRTAGQAAELARDFGGTPNQAASRAGEIADSPGIQEALRRNLGPQAGDEIADMAGAQAESLRRLGRLRNVGQGEDAEMDFGDLAMSMSLLSPTSLIRTKSQAVGLLMRAFAGIPEGRATQIVEALFSREPGAMSNALRILDSAGAQGQRALRDIVASVAVGGQAGRGINALDEETGAGEPVDDVSVAEQDDDDIVDPAPTEAGPWDAFSDADGSGGGVPYGTSVIQSIFPEAVITDNIRDEGSKLGRANPGSLHVNSSGAVDVRPIPGMTFDEFVARIEENGYEIIEAIDEVNNPSGHATGPHWHVVIA